MSGRYLTGLFEQISGSDALRNEYLDAEKAKDDAEEHQMLVFSKKKSVVAEKRQKKEQKEEAEKHLAALEELKALKTEQVVWELYVLEHDLARVVAEKVELEEEMRACAIQRRSAEQGLADGKKEVARLQKVVTLARKKTDQQRLETDQYTPEMTKVREVALRRQRKMKISEKKRVALRAEEAQLRKTIQGLEKDLADLEALRPKEEEEEDVEGGGGGGGGDLLDLRGEDLAEYHACKERAGAATVQDRAAWERLELAQKADEETKDRLTTALASINAQLHTCQARRTEAATKVAALTTELDAAKAELEDVGMRLQVRTDTRGKGGGGEDRSLPEREES